MRGRWFTSARALAVAMLILLIIWTARVDVPRFMMGIPKGDEATYVSMALSVANDGDLTYRAEDLRRFYRLVGNGPEGIFLKPSSTLHWHLHAGWPPIALTKTPVPTDRGLDYGKAFAYSVAAAPFAAVLGLGGLLLFNILLLALGACCAVLFCRARLGRFAGTLLGVAFIGASVVPVYTVWLTPEIFNFTLVLVAYFLWLYKEVAPPTAPAWLRRPWLEWISVVLLGIATYSKPPNALLVAPLVVMAIARGRWRHAMAATVLFLLVSGGLFGLHELVTGEWNYQDDDRGTVFQAADAGSKMATDEANDENIFEPHFVLRMLRYNVPYFLIGRDAGLVPYFFPGVLIAALWLARWRRATLWQWATAGACVFSILGLLIIAPVNWNGAGGPIGNRYFLPIYPVMLFLLPADVGLWSSLVAMIVGWTFVGAILIRPVSASHHVWENPARWPLRLLPIELTMMQDLPVFLNPRRAHVEVSKDPEVLLYYMDNNMYEQEPGGFWVAGPGTTDIVIRTERPLTRLDVRLGSSIANEVTVSLGGHSAPASLRPNQEQALQFRPPPGVFAHASYQIVLTITTSAGFYPRQFDPRSPDIRHLGVFVRPTYEVK